MYYFSDKKYPCLFWIGLTHYHKCFQKNWFSYVTIIFKLLRQCLSFFFGHTCRVNFAGALWTGPWHGKTYQREFFALKHMYIFLYYIRKRFTSISLIVTQTLRLLRPIFFVIFLLTTNTVSWNNLMIKFHSFYSCVCGHDWNHVDQWKLNPNFF